jgi:hypothetical protein
MKNILAGLRVTGSLGLTARAKNKVRRLINLMRRREEEVKLNQSLIL